MSTADVRAIDAVVRWVTSLAGAFLLPLIALGVALYLLRAKGAPDRIKRLLEPFASVKLLGQEFVLDHAAEVTSSAEAAFRTYRAQTKARYDALVKEHRIDTLHRQLVCEVLAPAIGGLDKATDFRSTIHVRDILFAESYYQLVPYFPAGGGIARSWSIRYGIVGKTWRQGESNGEGHLQISKQDLIDSWGMTKGEAERAKATRPSLLAVILRDATEKQVGVFFADSTDVNAFGATKADWTSLARVLEDEARSRGLTKALASMAAALPREPLVPMLGKDQA
jgi:hypothetical protein